MFPDINRSVRFHKISDFYTLAVLIQKFEAEGLVLTDRRRNKLAWDILVAFGTGVDQVAEALRTLQIKKLEPGQDLCRDYLQTVKEGVDSLLNRRKREQILRGLIGSLFSGTAADHLAHGGRSGLRRLPRNQRIDLGRLPPRSRQAAFEGRSDGVGQRGA